MTTKLVLLLGGLAMTASAAEITLHSSNVGISNLSIAEDATTITLSYDWTGTSPGVLLFQRYPAFKLIVHNVNNLSGTTFTRYAMELLDKGGDGDDNLDPLPYPAFVPPGFTTSNDSDGLSFGAPRSSSAFPSLAIDEVTDARDFNDYFGGSVASGSAFTVNHSLGGLLNGGDFLLFIRPNTISSPVVPEPSTYALMAGALGGLLLLKRRG